MRRLCEILNDLNQPAYRLTHVLSAVILGLDPRIV